ncbi:MAG: branched-chain-amino-acid transaminase [Balneolaceae bacterium]
MNNYLIYNGSLIPEAELRVSPLNRGMMYGDGCFDTLRSYKGKFLKLEEHFHRFIAGANYLGIEAHFGFEDFKFKILELLGANKLMDKDTLVRVQCWRDGERGYSTESSNAHWITSIIEIKAFKEVVSLSTVNTRVIPKEALERKFKLSNGLNYIQAVREANELGADDALMLTIQKKVSETTKANIFWVKENTVFTPSVICDLLPGITRNLIIDLLTVSESFDVEEGVFDLNHLKEAEAVFVTNSIREIISVDSIDEIQFDRSHRSVRAIKKSFEEFKFQNLA